MSRAALDPMQSAVVLASAGTGKTWTLTARIVRLLLSGAEQGGVLALTFTRKAAAEMRARVAARLQALAFADEALLLQQLREIDAPTDAATVARARGLFEQFIHAELPLSATTLHAFCQQLLTRFALEAEVPAGFELVEDESELRATALTALLRDAHRAPDSAVGQALIALAAEDLSEWEVRGLLNDVFEHRTEFWAASEGTTEPLAMLQQALASALDYSEDEAPYGAIDAPSLTAALKVFVLLLADLGNVGTIHHHLVEPAIEALGEQRLAILSAALLTKTGTARIFKPAQSKYSEAQREAVTHHFATLSEAVLATLETQRRAATYRRTVAAMTLALALLEHFAEALRRSHQLGFAELEWRTVQLLRNSEHAEWVRYKLDHRLEHLLLDEFQDTNPTQWRLLLPLLEEFANGDGGQRTAFLVGDAKQSIYGFRRAEPKLLDVASHWLQGQLRAGVSTLDESRRSAPAIIHFVNALFAGDAGSAIGFAAHQTALGHLHGAVEIAPLIVPSSQQEAANDAPLRNPLTTAREISEDRRAATEGEWVAARIRSLIDSGTAVSSRDGQHRAMHYGDVMVLARHRTHLGALERALGASGIPYVSATRGTLLQTALAQDVMALLTVLDAPFRNLELAHALRSPLFSASDAELLALATTASEHNQSWYAALADLPQHAALARAAHWLPQWRALAETLPPHDLLDRIAAEGDLLRRTAAARPHDRLAAANLSALLQLALDVDHGRYPTLDRFLRRCKNLGESRGPDEAPPPSHEPRVRVMTIHAAKGLEAPAVFLVNTAPMPRHPQAGWRVDWPAEAERPQVIVHTGKAELREALSQGLIDLQQTREQRESLNLLYVAVTRAQQYLFVSGFQAGKSVQDDSWHARCSQALAALPETVADDQGLLRRCEGVAPVLSTSLPIAAEASPLDPRLLQPLHIRPALVSATAAIDPAAALHGQTVHAALQWLTLQPDLAASALRQCIERQLHSRLTELPWQAALDEARAVLAAAALAPFFAPGLKAWNEQSLSIETADGVQQHVLDRLVDTHEALWVLDYKTHRNSEPALVLEGARAQLQRYVAAVQALYPQRRVRAAVIWTPQALLLELTER